MTIFVGLLSDIYKPFLVLQVDTVNGADDGSNFFKNSGAMRRGI
jgi:hypothetical protein